MSSSPRKVLVCWEKVREIIIIYSAYYCQAEQNESLVRAFALLSSNIYLPVCADYVTKFLEYFVNCSESVYYKILTLSGVVVSHNSSLGSVNV